MPKSKALQKTDMRFLLYGGLTWGICAVILLPLAAFICLKAGVGEGTMGYISSALSFIIAAAAGAVAASKSGGGILAGALAAVLIIIMLLTVGFIVKGAELSSGGVLSVVSFTLTGCVFGAFFFSGGKNKGRKSRVNPKRSRL